MPYRRLPNTDAARLRALKNALDKSERVAVSDMSGWQSVTLPSL